MIPIPVYDLPLIPLVFGLVLLAVAGVYYSARHRKAGRRPPQNRIYRCVACGHVYVDARDIPLARCGRCGLMNEAVRR